MAKKKTSFICNNCGYQSTQFLGKCPNCLEWNTLEEVHSTSSVPKNKPATEAQNIKNISIDGSERIKLGIPEVDRVFGGGIVRGSVNLIGGEPGIGKSTLMLEVASAYSKVGKKSLYVSGEESPSQVSMRANRIGASDERMELAFEVDLELILEMARECKPDVLFVDSVQILTIEGGIPGSPSVVREATRRLVEFAKTNNITIFLIGHVTKEGTIAGPKTLEHLVDAVSYLDGDKYSTLRIFSGVKNRFGPTNEVGIMEMTDKGLIPADHHKLLSASLEPGVAITAVSMGNRPIALEVQALLSPTYFPNPRRVVTGCSMSRTMMIMAVLEKRCGLAIGKLDVFVNIVGGISSEEPSLDLPIAIAMASSFIEKSVPEGVSFVGEIGLTGEIRPVTNLGVRIKELANLGQETIIIPKQNTTGINLEKAEIVKVISVKDVLSLVWPRQG